jgi:4-hydroxyphenylpyruvate dioxygenase
MIPTVASVTLGGSLPERLRAAAAAGFAGFELFDSDLEGQSFSPAELRRIIEDAGLALIDLFPLRDFEGLPAEQRPAMLDRASRYLDLAAELGAGMVMACSSVHPDSSPELEGIVDDLRRVGDLAAARGLRLAYEGLAWGRHVHDYRAAWDLVRRADHGSVGLVLDSFHILARGLPVTPIREIPPGRIFLVQVSDAPALDLDYTSWSRGHRTLPGRGGFDLSGFAAALRATGYDDVFSLECFSPALREEVAPSVAREGHAALAALWSGADPANSEGRA